MVATTAHTRPGNMVVSHLHSILRLPRLPRGSALRLHTTRTAIPTRANRVPFAQENHRATAVRHTRPVHRQHCREHLLRFHKMLEYLLLAFHVARHKRFILRSHGLLRRLPNDLHGVVPSAGTRTSSVFPPSQDTVSTKGARAHTAAPFGQVSNSATRTRALAPFPHAAVQTRQWGPAPLTLPPSTMAKVPVPHTLPPGTCRAARRLP